VGWPRGSQRVFLSSATRVSLVIVAGNFVPSAFVPGITIRSPSQPWASWHSTQVIHRPLAEPSGPMALRRTPVFRTLVGLARLRPHRYSTDRW
jgi:hypothetical protein